MPKELITWNKLPAAGKWLLALALLVPAFAFAQDDAEEVEELEAFVMTGSRIKRLDIETVNPVLQLTADSIEESGFTTVGDALRALPLNSGQALTPADAGTSFTPGLSSINLRGLGNNNTLLLVNGRRTAPYAAPGFNGLQTMFDLNSIPEGAIETIEILKDGASAIYGSDAVSGVINVVLKKDYQGISTKVDFGNYADADAFEYGASVVVGNSTANTSFITAITADYIEAMSASELSYTAEANHGISGNNLQARANVRAVYEDRSLLESDLAALGVDIAWLEGPAFLAVDDWYNLESTRGYPGYLTYQGTRYTSNTPDPTLDDMVPGRNFYNYQAVSGFLSEVKTFSWYTRVDHTFNDNLYGFAELSFSRVESESRSAGATIDIENGRGLHEGEPMYMPAENPYNVFNEDIFNGRRRFLEMGNRINDVTSDTPRILVGLGGEFGSDWAWESGLLYAKNTVTNIAFAGVDYKLQQALLGLGQAGDGSLFWDPTLPAEDRVYFNWFGLNSKEMVDFITVYNPNVSQVKLYQWDASVSGTITELPAGPLQMAAGVEARRESLADRKTDLNATRMILGGSEGSGFEGEREVQSVYVEFNIPVFEDLEMQLAGRYEKYSDDGFDSDVRPKVAVKYRPTDWLVLRASYNESFKAPDLAFLNIASSTSFTSFQFTDPVTGNEIDQIQTRTEGNKNLGPELTDSYYAGVVVDFGSLWEPLDGLTVAVDYFQLEQTDVLAQLSDFFGWNEFFTGAAAGDPLFSDKVVRDPATNEVLFVRDVYENISEAEYNGWDFLIQYAWETQTLGEFAARLDLTYLESYKIDDIERAGNRLRPRVRSNLSLAWSKGDWDASVFVQYIQGREVNDWTADLANFLPISSNDATIQYDVDDQFVVNPRVSYSGLWDSKVTLGINNVFNEIPPADPTETAGATVGVNYVKPLFWYLSWEKEF